MRRNGARWEDQHSVHWIVFPSRCFVNFTLRIANKRRGPFVTVKLAMEDLSTWADQKKTTLVKERFVHNKECRPLARARDNRPQGYTSCNAISFTGLRNHRILIGTNSLKRKQTT